MSELGVLATKLAAVKRSRSDVEAPKALTDAYIQFVFALGHAQVGDAGRARELVASATGALSFVAEEPVHATLIAACAARVEQRIAGEDDGAPLPAEIIARIDALDRIHLYKIDRFMWEVSAFTQVASEPISSFSHRTRVPATRLAFPMPDLSSDERTESAFTTIRGRSLTDKLERVGAIARAAQRLPSERREPLMARLVEHFAGITDGFNTNSHYCWSAIRFVDALVSAIASHRATRTHRPA